MDRIRYILQDGAPGSSVEISGWVSTRRDSGTFSFLELTDGSCLKGLQVIADAGIEGYEDVVKKIGTGASVKVRGELKESPGKGQRVELHADKVVLLGSSAPDYPLHWPTQVITLTCFIHK